MLSKVNNYINLLIHINICKDISENTNTKHFAKRKINAICNITARYTFILRSISNRIM